jgi:hypothetical protein
MGLPVDAVPPPPAVGGMGGVAEVGGAEKGCQLRDKHGSSALDPSGASKVSFATRAALHAFSVARLCALHSDVGLGVVFSLLTDGRARTPLFTVFVFLYCVYGVFMKPPSCACACAAHSCGF